MAIPYYHVDAFTGELFAGNPAGVCILSAFLADSIMQKIAAENRHSETAFVPRADGDFDLRWFTPKVEDDLCVHATLASAYVLALRKHNVWPVRFHTRSGMLTVAQDQDGPMLRELRTTGGEGGAKAPAEKRASPNVRSNQMPSCRAI